MGTEDTRAFLVLVVFCLLLFTKSTWVFLRTEGISAKGEQPSCKSPERLQNAVAPNVPMPSSSVMGLQQYWQLSQSSTISRFLCFVNFPYKSLYVLQKLC